MAHKGKSSSSDAQLIKRNPIPICPYACQENKLLFELRKDGVKKGYPIKAM
jgi:hypothetical protein